jgi:hypothetical protein
MKEKEIGKRGLYFWYVEFKFSSCYIVALLLRRRKKTGKKADIPGTWNLNDTNVQLYNI